MALAAVVLWTFCIVIACIYGKDLFCCAIVCSPLMTVLFCVITNAVKEKQNDPKNPQKEEVNEFDLNWDNWDGCMCNGSKCQFCMEPPEYWDNLEANGY